MLTQDLERQYVDKQKLAEFWRTNPDFAGNDCRILEVSHIDHSMPFRI